MTSGYTNRRHALLSALILIGVIGLFYVAAIQPAVKARMGFYERIDNLQFQHEKLSQLISQRDHLLVEAKQLEQYPFDQASFLGEKTTPLAAADLQQILNTLISNNGGTVVSTQVIDERGEDLFQKVTVNVTMQGDIEAFQRSLFEIYQNKPALFIDNLMVTRQNNRRAPRQYDPRSRRRVVAADSPDMLEIRFAVSGYIYKSAPST